MALELMDSEEIKRIQEERDRALKDCEGLAQHIRKYYTLSMAVVPAVLSIYLEDLISEVKSSEKRINQLEFQLLVATHNPLHTKHQEQIAMLLGGLAQAIIWHERLATEFSEDDPRREQVQVETQALKNTLQTVRNWKMADTVDDLAEAMANPPGDEDAKSHWAERLNAFISGDMKNADIATHWANCGWENRGLFERIVALIEQERAKANGQNT